MPITLGPRNVRDDRGKAVTGRSINELLGDVRVEAGKRRFSWRMVGVASALSLIGYLNLARTVIQSILRGGIEAWIFAILCLILVAFVAWGIFRAWAGKESGKSWLTKDTTSQLREKAVADVLVALHRCGACGYALRKDGAENDGCIVCSECGAAWHARRLKAIAADAPAVFVEVERTLRSHEQSNRREHDDRSSLLAIATHRGRTDGKPAASMAGAAVAEHLGRSLRRSRMRWSLWFSGVGLVLIAFGVIAWKFRPDVGPWMTGVGLVLCLIAVCVWGTSNEWKARKKFFLSYRICAACLAELNSPSTYDGCVVCTTCRAAWKSDSLGDSSVTSEMLARVNIPCARCGYNRNGLSPDAPCPECGLGCTTPARNPHCAVCDTLLDGPSRVCPRCMHQAGVEYR